MTERNSARTASAAKGWKTRRFRAAGKTATCPVCSETKPRALFYHVELDEGTHADYFCDRCRNLFAIFDFSCERALHMIAYMQWTGRGNYGISDERMRAFGYAI